MNKFEEVFKGQYIVDPTGCWLFVGYRNQHGYGMKTYKQKIYRAHRLAYILAVSDFPTELFVCHKCDIRNCINPVHLFLGTNQDNVDDREKKNRGNQFKVRGSKNTNTVISDHWIDYIRKSSAPADVLARQFGVHRSTIYRIKNGERRKFA